MDVLCYFGILHHTKNKIDNIKHHLVLVRDGGFILLAEALIRPKLPIATLVGSREDRSAHEGHLQMSAVTNILSEMSILKTIILYEFGTVLFTAAKYAFGGLLLWSRGFYQALLKLDMFTASRIGSYFEFLKGGSILLLAKVVRD